MVRLGTGYMRAGCGKRPGMVAGWLSLWALLSAPWTGSLALALSASTLATAVLCTPALAQGAQPDDGKRFDDAIAKAHAAWKAGEWGKARDAYLRALGVSVDWFNLHRIQLAYVYLQLEDAIKGLEQLERLELYEQARGNLKWAESEAANPGDESKPLKLAEVKRQLEALKRGEKPTPAPPPPPTPTPTPAPGPTPEQVAARAKADGLVSAAKALAAPAQIEQALGLVEQALKDDPENAGAKSAKADLERRKIDRDAQVSGVLQAARSLAEDRLTKEALQQVSQALELNPRSQEALDLRKTIESLYTGATYKPGDTVKLELKDLNIVIETAWIPAGVFTMGSPKTEADRANNEGPQHLVRIGGGPNADKGFWMMTTEVQQGQWQAVMGSNRSLFKNSGPTYPVEDVTWYDAVEFANKLTEAVAKKNPGMNLKPYYTIAIRRGVPGNIQEAEVRPIPGNRGYRLPTEAEWEYACRAGTTTAFHFGQTISTDVANYNGNLVYSSGVKGEWRQRTTPTAFFGVRGRNAFGLYDMHGNVREWCWDWYEEGWYNPEKMAGERVNPTGPQVGGDRVLRGGSWADDPWVLRSANRRWNWPTYRSELIGFRLLLDSE